MSTHAVVMQFHNLEKKRSPYMAISTCKCACIDTPLYIASYNAGIIHVIASGRNSKGFEMQ